MKHLLRTSALVLTGALLIAACGNKEQKSEANVNENPVEEKMEVKAVEGRKNFSDKAVITPWMRSAFATAWWWAIFIIILFARKPVFAISTLHPPRPSADGHRCGLSRPLFPSGTA